MPLTRRHTEEKEKRILCLAPKRRPEAIDDPHGPLTPSWTPLGPQARSGQKTKNKPLPGALLLLLPPPTFLFAGGTYLLFVDDIKHSLSSESWSRNGETPKSQIFFLEKSVAGASRTALSELRVTESFLFLHRPRIAPRLAECGPPRAVRG